MCRSYRPGRRASKEILSTVGTNIRTLRKKARLSQQVIADRAEIDRAYLSAIETGQQNTSIAVLEGIAGALGTSIPFLFGGV